MRRRSSFIWIAVVFTFWIFSDVATAAANAGSVADLSEWNVSSHKVNLTDHRGGSGDIQSDQKGWIHLGANHLEGGDIRYEVAVGRLSRTDILEVWIDGYSTSNALNIGPTVFIGTGKNRYEQITRLTGDAWRPFVFRFADDALYGDITDPSNRNENWRSRYPSSKYAVRRIDKSPEDLLRNRILPIRVSMTGAEDFIIKRIEVVVYGAKPTPKTLPSTEERPPSLLPSVPPESSGPIAAPQPGYFRGYTIQVGAYHVLSTAVAMRDRLLRKGYDAYIRETIKWGDRFFRVRVGRYPDKSLAHRDAARLRHSGFDTWITKSS